MDSFADERELYRVLVESAPDIIASSAPDGTITSLNPAFEVMTGWPVDAWVGRHFIELIHPDDRGFAEAVFATLVDGRTPPPIELRLLRQSGDSLYTESTARPVVRDGRVVGVLGITRDITDRMQRAELDRRLSAIVESSDDAIISICPLGIIRSWNAAAERLFGYPASEAVGRSSLLLVPPERVDEFSRNLRKLSAGGRVEPHETVRIHKDGRRLHVSLTVSPIMSHTGQIVGSAAVLRDVTQQKKLDEERDRIEKMLLQGQKLQALGQISAGIAHEIRSPVSVLALAVKAAEDYLSRLTRLARAAEPAVAGSRPQRRSDQVWDEVEAGEILEDWPRMLSDAREAADRLRSLASGVLEFSHIGDSSMEEADINEILRKTIQLCATEAKGRVEIRDGFASLPPSRCYRPQLAQAFLNIIMNAVEAIDGRGEIHVTTAVERGHAVIRISDTGQGIEPEILHRIFEPYFTTKPPGEGTGLGLYLAKQIIDAHAGTIDVASERGNGTTFTIRLPLGSNGS